MEIKPSTDTLSISSSLRLNSCSLKRKRPPSIEIPNVLQEIQTDKLKFRELTPQNDTVCFSGIGVGVFSTKGKKKFMEDTHKIVSCLSGTSNKGFFGVYDGHGGRKAAEFVAENLHNNIFETMKDCIESKEKGEAIRDAYLKTDQQFLEEGVVSGACCVTALIEGQEIFVSNLGDCRAVLCRGGVAEFLTTDHKADTEDEKKRIENDGGFVENHRGAWRVHGVLAVSRSIGDAHLKKWVVAEPDTKILSMTPDMEFLVLASDGLWDEVSNQEAVDTVSQFLVPRKLSSSGNVSTDYNDENYGTVNISPSSKIRRVSLVKKWKETTTSPSPRYKKTFDSWKDGFACENNSPVVSNSPRIPLVVKRVNTKPESPSHENAIYCNKKTTTVHNWSDGVDDFACENSSPPSKSRKISLVKRISMKTESSPRQENTNKSPAAAGVSFGLVAACKELANLAARRGSFDDITVMVIDLNHFRCNNNN